MTTDGKIRWRARPFWSSSDPNPLIAMPNLATVRANGPGECDDDISVDRRELSARLDPVRRPADARLRGGRPAAGRSEERRVGQEWVSTCKSWGGPVH